MNKWNFLIVAILFATQFACQTVRRVFNPGPYWVYVSADSGVGAMAHSLCGAAGETFVAFGGINEATGTPLSNDLYLFHSEQRRWQIIAGLPGPAPRNFASLAISDQQIFVFGGETAQQSATADSFVFEIQTGKWTRMETPTRLQARKKASLIATKDQVILFGGLGSEAVRTWGVYKIPEKIWSVHELPPGMDSRVSHVALAIDDHRVFIWGGFIGEQRQADGFIIDTRNPAAFETIPAGPLSPRGNARALLIQNKIYIWGGMPIDGKVNTGAVFDLQAKTWTSLPPLPGNAFETMKSAEIVVWDKNDFLLVGGRFGAEGFQDQIWKFSTQDSRWSPFLSSPSPSGRIAHCTVPLPKGRVAVFGGIGYQRGTQTLSQLDGIWLLEY